MYIAVQPGNHAISEMEGRHLPPAACRLQVLAVNPSAAAYCTLEGLSSLHVCAGESMPVS